MNRKNLFMLLLLSAVATAGCGRHSRMPTAVEVPTDCTEPVVIFWASADTVAQGNPSTIHLQVQEAEYTMLYQVYEGRTDSARVAADTTFTFRSSDLGVHTFKAVAKSLDGDCPTSKEVKVVVVEKCCTVPFVAIEVDSNRIRLGSVIRVQVNTLLAMTGAEVFVEHNGDRRHLTFMAGADLEYVFHPWEAGIFNVFVVAKALDGDCETRTGRSILVVQNDWFEHWCDSGATLEPSNPVWKACYQACPGEGVTGLRSYLNIRRANDNPTEQAQYLVSMGYYRDDDGTYYWSRRSLNGPNIQPVKVSVGLLEEWNDIGVYGLPAYPVSPSTYLYDVVVAFPTWTGLPDRDPNWQSPVTFTEAVTVQEEN